MDLPQRRGLNGSRLGNDVWKQIQTNSFLSARPFLTFREFKSLRNNLIREIEDKNEHKILHCDSSSLTAKDAVLADLALDDQRLGDLRDEH
ncbi:hypothetical protein B9G98_00524 [Wickerhamiella sorbophila]|uniref:Uncharacterized protein n=1 Tax=Wickerhamiella sorbophila TaxID=45607 RepID=A0A2T0FD33_9ASCO|nr:hypothetical protein B9G98_00524 [Wickerhamiella sorbophila]PRT52904.1 hypothetical protein B9G98_00524 [Wickerhamiella sorbophila]